MIDSEDFGGRPCKGAEGICKRRDETQRTLGLGGRAAAGSRGEGGTPGCSLGGSGSSAPACCLLQGGDEAKSSVFFPFFEQS